MVHEVSQYKEELPSLQVHLPTTRSLSTETFFYHQPKPSIPLTRVQLGMTTDVSKKNSDIQGKTVSTTQNLDFLPHQNGRMDGKKIWH
jgi:hypothetical protein